MMTALASTQNPVSNSPTEKFLHKTALTGEPEGLPTLLTLGSRTPIAFAYRLQAARS